jgi:outer membrane lipoprotein SlyB
MYTSSKTIGTVDNPEQTEHKISIPGAIFILGGAAIGTYVGLKIGGAMGAAVGALVGAFVGALASGLIKDFEVIVHPNGKVEVKYKVRSFCS